MESSKKIHEIRYFSNFYLQCVVLGMRIVLIWKRCFLHLLSFVSYYSLSLTLVKDSLVLA